ncbi:MAG TPA: polysaccharide biosynthesis/export family protein [Methylomirabilota bacterium]|jgi:polysaccharide export outer membrane protein
MKLYRILVITAILTTLVATGASAQQSAAAAPQPASAAKARVAPTLEEYRIGPEDVLSISVWKNDPMSRVLPVRPDGMISLPLLDDVMAAGLTPTELRNLLAQKLAEYVPSPAVTVIVNDVKSFKVSVIGEVVRPARYELKSRTSVLDVLALAGGFNQFAARTRIVVLRQEGDKKIRIPFNYNRVTNGNDEENLYLRPNDIVLVP